MARCSDCGTDNPSYVHYCGRCGKEISEDLRKEATKDQPRSDASSVRKKDLGFSSPMVSCKSCGKLTEANRACSSCGKDPAAKPPEAHTLLPMTPTPMVGGACAIGAGALAVVQGILFIVGEAVFFTVTGDLTVVLIILGIVEIVLGLASIDAGLNARRRRRYGRSLVGSILGMVAFGLGIGGLLGLVAVILIALSYDEFES